MAGHGEKQSRKRDLAISALLECSTIPEAAQKVGIGTRTLRRWLTDETFLREFRAAKRRVVDAAIGRLQQASAEAVSVLKAVMLDPNSPAMARLSAARIILEMSVKAIELEDIEARLSTLEKAIGER